MQYAINYVNNFDGKGKKLNIDLQYEDSESTEDSPILENGSLTELNSQITKSKDYLIQLDYVNPIGENAQFEAGFKTTFQDLHSDFKVRDANGNPFLFDPSNAINFKQNIYAFYVQYGNKIDKFSYLLGLRSEVTDIDLDVITTGQNLDKNFTEWFPTINLGYEINESNNLTLGYSRRIRRPRHWFLNPFETRSSATSIFRGNPDLIPTFTSSVDLGYTTKIYKFNLGASIYYQFSDNVMQPVAITENRDFDGELRPVFIRQPINLDSENRYGFEFTTNYNPTRKIRLSGSFNYFKFNTDAFTYTYLDPTNVTKSITLDEVNNSSWFARFNARITLPLNIQWQTRMMYRAPQTNAQGSREDLFTTSLALSKDLFKDKATLVLNVSDLFNSRKRESTTRYYDNSNNLTTISNGTFQWRERQISLSFTYRFNQKKKRERPQRNYDDGGGEGFGK